MRNDGLTLIWGASMTLLSLGCRTEAPPALASDAQPVAVPSPTPSAQDAVRHGVDGGDLIRHVLAEADLHDNTASAALDDAGRVDRATLQLQWGLDRATAVVLGTVIDADSAACQMRTVVASVDDVLMGRVDGHEMTISNAPMASVVDSEVFRYHVNYEKGRRYVFFLGGASTRSESCRTAFYGSELTVPIKQAQK